MKKTFYLAAVMLVLLNVVPARAEECTPQSYGSLVAAAKVADQEQQWGRSVEL